MKSDENNPCPCGDRVDLGRSRQDRSRDFILAHLEIDMGLTFSRKAALFIGFVYLACALSVALHPQGLWDIGTFFLLIFAGNFMIVVALDLWRKI